MGELAIFAGLAFFVLFFSIGVVTLKSPVTAVVFLVLDLFVLAGLYAFMGAEFVFAIQIIIYAGAVLVLFMFVIMMLNLDPIDLIPLRLNLFRVLLALIGFFGFLGFAVRMLQSPVAAIAKTAGKADNTLEVALCLFSKYLWPFELASILILLAIICAIVIAKKDHTRSSRG